MKIPNYDFPKSSFLAVEKDYSIIIKKILQNERLKKLLYYTTDTALDEKQLNTEQVQALLKNNIRIVPKITLSNDVRTYLIITIDDFSPSENPEFRNNSITFDIVCHLDQWSLKDFQLRPVKIAGELDFLFNEQKLTGIGTLEFVSANQLILNQDFALFTLIYKTVHGEEDKQGMLNPMEEKNFQQYFKETYN